MTVSGASTDSSSGSIARPTRLASRELRADSAAARQGLILRKSVAQCGGDESCMYDLFYDRYNQPVALNLKLEAVEVWLGIRETTRN